MKEIARTGPELYFSQSVLLMYGTNCLNLLTLVHYRCLCEMFMTWIYLAVCIYNSSLLYLSEIRDRDWSNARHVTWINNHC